MRRAKGDPVPSKRKPSTPLSIPRATAKSRFVEMFGNPTEANKQAWSYSRLGDLLLIERGGSPRPIKSFLTNDSRGINWIKIGDATDGSKFITGTKEKIKKEGVRFSRMVHKGDFLLSNSMSFGRPCILDIEGCIHDGWLVLRDEQGQFDSLWLYEALSSQAVYEAFKQRVRGGVVNNLNKDLVSSVTLIVPPLALQQEFATFVSQVDKLRFEACYAMYFLCEAFTLLWSTMAYMSVVSIFAWPKSRCTCSMGMPLSIAFVASVRRNLCG